MREPALRSHLLPTSSPSVHWLRPVYGRSDLPTALQKLLKSARPLGRPKPHPWLTLAMQWQRLPQAPLRELTGSLSWKLHSARQGTGWCKVEIPAQVSAWWSITYQLKQIIQQEGYSELLQLPVLHNQRYQGVQPARSLDSVIHTVWDSDLWWRLKDPTDDSRYYNQSATNLSLMLTADWYNKATTWRCSSDGAVLATVLNLPSGIRNSLQVRPTEVMTWVEHLVLWLHPWSKGAHRRQHSVLLVPARRGAQAIVAARLQLAGQHIQGVHPGALHG